MERRHELAVNSLAWQVGHAPLFLEDQWQQLESRGAHGYVAIDDEAALPALRVVGYMQLFVAKRFVVIRHLAVELTRQRRGVGRELVANALGWLDPIQRPRLFADVAPNNLAAQLFFSALRFEGAMHPDGSETIRFAMTLVAGDALKELPPRL